VPAHSVKHGHMTPGLSTASMLPPVDASGRIRTFQAESTLEPPMVRHELTVWQAVTRQPCGIFVEDRTT
jgi:hypothetical protein